MKTGGFLTGGRRYTADLDLPDQAHAIVVRAPHAHARIAAIDAEAARNAPGVLGVYTSEDLRAARIGAIPSWTRTPPFKVLDAEGTEMPLAEQYPLATGRVRYVGEPVALVVAESASAARDAAELVAVDWRPLPAVTEVDAALAQGAPLLWPELPSNRSSAGRQEIGPAVARCLRAAAHVVELEVDFPRAIVAFMEPRAAIGSYDPATCRYTLRAGCQSAHQLRTVLAQVLGVAQDALRVIVPDVGGGFGARNIAYPEFVLVLFAARSLGRPVKWDRRAQRELRRRRPGASAGRSLSIMTAASSRSRSPRTGATAATSRSARCSSWCTGWRRWCAGRIASRRTISRSKAYSPTPRRSAAYRGVARAELAYLLERLVDAAARAAGIDRIELRRRNLIAPGEMPYRSAAGAVYPPAQFERNLDRGLEAIGWGGFPARRTNAQACGKLRGIGLSIYIENAGGAPSEFARVQVNGAGEVLVHVGTQDFGMGHETVFAQVLAEVLGVNPAMVRVIDGDTDAIEIGFAATARVAPGSAAAPSCRVAAA